MSVDDDETTRIVRQPPSGGAAAAPAAASPAAFEPTDILLPEGDAKTQPAPAPGGSERTQLAPAGGLERTRLAPPAGFEPTQIAPGGDAFEPTQLATSPRGSFDRTQAAQQIDRTEIAPRREAAGDTVLAGAPARQAAATEGGNMLSVGTYLHEFEITQVLGEGGFGIVYLAQDHSLGRRVALKEYMPSSLAARIGAAQVSVKSERFRETFEAGLKSFVNEARLLAQFDHPSLVKVYRFWEANGTAYMVMPFYEGITLKDLLKQMPTPPDEAWLRGLLEPLTQALAVIHAERCYHRDIAPDNIILLKGGTLPLLLDFGAARRVIGDMTQALTVILKPGYAPVEQYAEVPGMKQGPWTDVYALAAVVYYAICGRTPPTSVARLMHDSFVPLTQAGAGRYSPAFVAAIDHALAVRPEQRTQSIDALRGELGMAAAEVEGGGHRAAPSGAMPLSAPMVLAPSPPPSPAPAPAPAATPAARKGLPVVAFMAIGVLVVAGVAAAWFVTRGAADRSASSTATAVGPSATAALPATQASSQVAAASVPPAAAPVATFVPPAQPAGPIEPASEFARVVAQQTPGYLVEAAASKPKFRINKDNMSFTVRSEHEGRLYVFQYGTDGALVQIFPNEARSNNVIRAGVAMALPPPGSNWNVSAGGPPGTDRLLAIVSKNPRDFSTLGLKSKNGSLAYASLETVRGAAANWAGPGSPFAGRPTCAPGCADEYGAAVFSAEEVK